MIVGLNYTAESATVYNSAANMIVMCFGTDGTAQTWSPTDATHCVHHYCSSVLPISSPCCV